MLATLALLGSSTSAAAASATSPADGGCLGEFAQCPARGACILADTANKTACALCQHGEYLCPLPLAGGAHACARSAALYEQDCGPALRGSVHDWTLPTAERVRWLSQRANLSELVDQMSNTAAPISRLGIPGYQWLNDDVHSARFVNSTTFPDGCGLGASWSTETARLVGAAVGTEARAGHNTFVHEGTREHAKNGMGLTMYAPNINLVRTSWLVRGA